MYRNKCVNLIRTAKQDHYSTVIRLAEGQTTKLWRYINSFKKSKGNILPKILSLNGENILDKTIISEELNKTFLNPLSPKIDFYDDLLICATSWASNHKFMLLSKIFQETYYL